MDGLYQSSDWLRSNLVFLPEQESVSVHVTVFNTDSVDKDQYIALAISEFLKIVTDLDLLGNPCKCGVVIPLISGRKKVRLKVPLTLAEIEAELDIEPPSLFLMRWESSRKYEEVEEYSCPVDSSLLLKLDHSTRPLDRYYSYYREYRYSEAIKKHWEFSRSLYIEYFPNGKYGASFAR